MIEGLTDVPARDRGVRAGGLLTREEWVGELVHLAGLLVPFPMRAFGVDAVDDALAWLVSLGHGATADVPHRA